VLQDLSWSSDGMKLYACSSEGKVIRLYLHPSVGEESLIFVPPPKSTISADALMNLPESADALVAIDAKKKKKDAISPAPSSSNVSVVISELSSKSQASSTLQINPTPSSAPIQQIVEYPPAGKKRIRPMILTNSEPTATPLASAISPPSKDVATNQESNINPPTPQQFNAPLPVSIQRASSFTNESIQDKKKKKGKKHHRDEEIEREKNSKRHRTLFEGSEDSRDAVNPDVDFIPRSLHQTVHVIENYSGCPGKSAILNVVSYGTNGNQARVSLTLRPSAPQVSTSNFSSLSSEQIPLPPVDTSSAIAVWSSIVCGDPQGIRLTGRYVTVVTRDDLVTGCTFIQV